MIRKTLTILSLIGLLLSVGLWGVSYLRISYVKGPRWNHLSHGALSFTHLYALVSFDPVRTIKFESKQEPRSVPGFWRCEGFRDFDTVWVPHFHIRRDADWGIVWLIDIPLWMPFAVFAIRPALLGLVGHRRRKRKKLGLCLKCGYDLRASRERCPECGEEFGSTNVER